MNVSTYETVMTRQTEDQAAGEATAESPIVKSAESLVGRIPPNAFLLAAGAAIVGSLALQVAQRRKAHGIRRVFGMPARRGRGQLSLFVGQWVPTLLLLGIYDQFAKRRAG